MGAISMKFVDGNVKDLIIAYIGGGSRGWAWGLMSDLASEEKLSGTVKLYDIDLQAAKNNELIGNSISTLENVKGIWKYEAVNFDLFKRYGIIAAAGDRHLAEFVPNTWYLKNPETVKFWKFGLTTVDWRIKDLEERLNKSKAYVSGEEKFVLKQTGEEGVHQIKALLGLGDIATNINIPNKGQVTELPLGAIVETNALLRKDKIAPINAGILPADVNCLVIRNLMNTETVLEAALTKNLKLAYNAFANDPLVTIGLKEAKALFDEMIYNTKEYLRMYEI